MIVKTSPLEGYGDYEYSRTEKAISIDKEYFDMIDARIVNLDYKTIITRSKYLVGADGCGVKIRIGSRSGNLILFVWNPLSRAEERKTDEVQAILQELFSVCPQSWLLCGQNLYLFPFCTKTVHKYFF
jgi:hypothetical protein